MIDVTMGDSGDWIQSLVSMCNDLGSIMLVTGTNTEKTLGPYVVPTEAGPLYSRYRSLRRLTSAAKRVRSGSNHTRRLNLPCPWFHRSFLLLL